MSFSANLSPPTFIKGNHLEILSTHIYKNVWNIGVRIKRFGIWLYIFKRFEISTANFPFLFECT